MVYSLSSRPCVKAFSASARLPLLATPLASPPRLLLQMISQGHASSKCWGQNLNPVVLTAETVCLHGIHKKAGY